MTRVIDTFLKLVHVNETSVIFRTYAFYKLKNKTISD